MGMQGAGERKLDREMPRIERDMKRGTYLEVVEGVLFGRWRHILSMALWFCETLTDDGPVAK